jgi:hypothetical protein
MAVILLMAVLLGLGLEMHPGDGVRRAARGIRDGGVLAGVLARLGGLLAVALVTGVWLGAVLLIPGVRTEPAVRAAAALLAAAALVCAGWHRIATSSRMDLRRSRLLREPEPEFGLMDAFLGDLRRPAWHLFWWAAAPGLVLAVARDSTLAVPFAWLVFAISVLAWLLFLSVRLRRDRDKVLETPLFRTLHSLGGLALVALAGLLLAEALAASGLETRVSESILRPVLGAGGVS